jgi:hypothetical protein
VCIAIHSTCLIPSALAATAPALTLAWNSNPESDVTGYRVSYGTFSKVYSSVINVGTTPTTAVSGLTEGTTYYFVVSAVNQSGLQSAPSSEISYQVPVTGTNPTSLVPTTGWAVRFASSQELVGDPGAAINAFDGDPNTFWHSKWQTTSPPPPHEIQVDLGKSYPVAGFRYLPRQDTSSNGNIGQYEFYVSVDGVTWGQPVTTGTFPNSKSEKEVLFTEKSGRYVRLRGLTDASGKTYCCVAELKILQSITTTPPENQAPVAVSSSVTTPEDMPVGIALSASDADGNLLTYSVVSNPSRGVLSGTAPSLVYTPNADSNGTDSFTFITNDGTVNSNTATVSISVTPVNDVPVASSKSASTAEDTPVTIVLSASDKDGNLLTYTVVASPKKGTLSGTPPNLNYTPSPDINGSDSFTFRANDGTTNSAEATISISITPVNDAPVAIAKSVSTSKNTPVAIVLTSTDKDANPVTYSIISGPANGTLSGTAPNLTFSPKTNYSGSDSFTFQVNDGTVNSAAATISIAITPTNEAPVAIAKSVTTAEDTPVSVLLSGTDADGNALTYSVVSSPSRGVLSGTAPSLIYTPNADSNGTDSFTFITNDGTVNSNTATVSISITAVNDVPVASSKSASTAEDTPVTIVLSASDKDENPLTYAVVASPTKGTLSGTPPNLNYTPSPDINGSDSFTFRANDGTTNSAEATISISITPVNDAPVAIAKSVSTNKNTPVAIVLTSTDKDANPVTYSIISGPANGTLSGTAPNLTFSPKTNYSGSDSFTFQVNDGTVNSAVATISIAITPTNEAPVAIAKSVTTAEDTPVSVPLSGTDADGNPLTFSVIASPTKGTLSGTSPNLTYTPSADFNGSDSFTFRANDGLVNSTAATISITVTPVNDTPVAVAKSISTPKNIPIAVSLAGTDKDANALTYSVVSGPANGALTGTAQNLTYTPKTNYSGNDSFTFQVNDGTVNSAAATVSITVTPTNVAPVALAKSVTTAEDTPLAVTLIGSDADDNALTYSVTSNPAKGTLSGTAPNLSYSPSADFNGSDSFTFLVNDGTANSASATISISVTPVNDAPVATSLILTTAEDISLPIVLSGSDKDLNNLSFIMDTAPSNGTLTGTAPNFTYNPKANFNGSDQFTFRVNDGILSSQVATVFITVTSVNDAPSALAKSLTTAEDKAIPVVLGGSDPEGSNLTYTVLTVPSKGSLSGTVPNLSYSPAANFNGTDSFTYRVSDGTANSQTATISITVTPVNDAPVANPIPLDTPIDTPRVFALGGSDIDGDALTYSIIVSPTKGILSGTIPNLTYLPNAGFSGSDSFTFKTNDGSLDSATATVSVTVTPGNRPTPGKRKIFVSNSITVQATEAQAVTGQPLATEPDAGTPLIFTKVSGPAWLTVSADGVIGGTPDNSNVGDNSFTISVTDSLGSSDETVLTISVTNINQAPTFISNPITLAEVGENEAYAGKTLAGQAVDVDANDSLRYWKVSGPDWLNIALNGELSGTPPTGSAGLNSFTVGVADSSSAVAYSELRINVSGLPLPWTTVNLGTGQIEGVASYRAGTFTQAGSGAVGSTSDKLRFTYQTLSGDGEIIAKVNITKTVGPASLVGVMIRSSLAPKATQVFIGISDDKSYRHASRTKYAKNTSVAVSAPTGSSDSWIRLVRNAKKQQIYSYKSADGVNWTYLGATKSKMPANCQVGLVSSSGSDSTLTTSTFSNVSVAP